MPEVGHAPRAAPAVNVRACAGERRVNGRAGGKPGELPLSQPKEKSRVDVDDWREEIVYLGGR